MGACKVKEDVKHNSELNKKLQNNFLPFFHYNLYTVAHTDGTRLLYEYKLRFFYILLHARQKAAISQTAD